MTYVVCDLCGRDEPEIIISHSPSLDGPLVRCRNCRLVYINPRERDYTLSHFEEQAAGERYATIQEHTRAVMDTSLVDYELERRYKERFFGKRLKQKHKNRPWGRLLDIGCGLGVFVELAQKEGYEAYGLEPNSKTAAAARERGLKVITGVLEGTDFAPNSFETVTMFHVLEHLPSPRRQLRLIHPLLAEHGLLAIETPTIDSPWFKMLGRRWREFIPGHYYFFSPKTLSRLLAETGFRVLSVDRVGKYMSLRFFLSRLSRYSRPLARGLLSLAAPLGLDRVGFYLNLSDVMLVLARKEHREQG